MTQEGIYKNPVLLNQAAHKNVKIAQVTDYSFSRNINSALVTGQEFLHASKFYPIVFVSGQNDEIVPLAILGLRNNENLFVNDEGKWKEGVYIPTFIRRYPFILAENDLSGENFTVSVDAGYEGFDSDEGMSLFDEDGNPSEDMSKMMEFLRQFQIQNVLTQEFIKKISEYGLLKDFAADITMPAGEKIGFRGLKMINEKALVELDDEKALDLFRRGFLAWVYGHLFSLSNFRVLGAIEGQKPVSAGTA